MSSTSTSTSSGSSAPSQCPAGVLDAVRAHVESDTTREVGGFLVGSMDGGCARITGHIPALAAVGSVASLTFTHDTWDKALDRLETEHPGEALVGWYHSHPGHGVFLSDYDKFIQTNFFSGDGMAALVIDPLTGAEGWFHTRRGEAVEVSRTEGTRRDPRTATAGGKPGRLVPKVLTVAIGLFAAGSLGYAVGFGAGGDDRPAGAVVTEPAGGGGSSAVLAAELASARTRIAELEAAAAPAAGGGPAPAAGPAPAPGPVTVVYRIRPGDSLWRVAEAVYGDGHAWTRLRDANPGLDPAALPVDQPVRITLTPEATR